MSIDKAPPAVLASLPIARSVASRGARIQLYDCNATGAQKWTVSNGAPVNHGSGAFLDATGQLPADGTRLQIWNCTNAANQIEATPGGFVAVPSGQHLDDPLKKDVAMRLVSAAENSSLDWRSQFAYVEDIGDGRGYTAGIVGFCSGTGDLLELVEAYAAAQPSNVLARYLPALRSANGTASHEGLDPDFPADWRTAAADPVFQLAQETERDRVYFTPAVRDGKADGVRALGQFAYYDAAVMHGYEGMLTIRDRALRRVLPPIAGGDECAWLGAFLDERVAEMKTEQAHSDTSRVDTAQRVFLADGNVDLNPPLAFTVYGEVFRIG
jgi:chitosanase